MGWDAGRVKKNGWGWRGEDGLAFNGVWEKVIGCFVFRVLKYIEAVSDFYDVRLLLCYHNQILSFKMLFLKQWILLKSNKSKTQSLKPPYFNFIIT